MNLPAFFTAEDGKEWTLDEWHPLPFIRTDWGVVRCASIPDTKAGHRLVRKFADGTVRPWSMFTTWGERLKEKENPATHWMVRSWSDYTI